MPVSTQALTEIKRRLKSTGITDPQHYYQEYLLREYLQNSSVELEVIKRTRYFASIMARDYDFATQQALFAEEQSLKRIADGKVNPPVDRAVFWSGGFDVDDPMFYGWGRKDAERWVLEQTLKLMQTSPTADYQQVRDQLYHTVAMTDAGIDLLNAMWDYMDWEGQLKPSGEKYSAREQMLIKRAVTAPLIIKFAQVAKGTITLNIDDTDIDSFFRQNELPVIMTNGQIKQVRSVSYDRVTGELTEVVYADKFDWYQSQKNQWVDSIKSRYTQARQVYTTVAEQLGQDYLNLTSQGSNILQINLEANSLQVGDEVIQKLWEVIHREGCWWNSVLQFLPNELARLTIPSAEIITYDRLLQALFDEALDSILNLNEQNFFLADYWQNNPDKKPQQLEKENWRLQSLADLIVPNMDLISTQIPRSNMWPDIRPKEIIQIGDKIPGFVVPEVSLWLKDVKAAQLMKPKAIQEVTNYFQDCSARGIHLKYHGPLTQRHSAGFAPYYHKDGANYYAANIELNRQATPDWLKQVVADAIQLEQLLTKYNAGEVITTYSLPRGRIEKGETIEMAAKRQSLEEVGYQSQSTSSKRLDRTVSGKRGNYHLTLFFDKLSGAVGLTSRGKQTENSIPSPFHNHSYTMLSDWITKEQFKQAVDLFAELCKLRFKPSEQAAKEWIVGEYKSLLSQYRLLSEFELE